jgi:hypothetical protein
MSSILSQINYMEKKLDLPKMEKKIELLKKIISEDEINTVIALYETYTDDRLDALYLAYYNLKDKYCKVKRASFGTPKLIKYSQKTIKIDDSEWWYYYSASNTATCSWSYDTGGNTWSFNNYRWDVNYTWDTTTTTNGAGY